MRILSDVQTMAAHFVRTSVIAGVIAGVLAFSSTAQAGPITFTFDYSGNTAGVGFLDPATGAARQAALTTAANLFSDMFGSHFSNGGTIALAVTSSDNSASGTLMSAGSEISASGGPGFTLNEVVKDKLLTGVDHNGAANDGSVDVNWGHGWQIDPNVPAVAPDFDFFAALFHEFTHALGFSSTIAQNGTDVFGDTAGRWGAYDSFLVDKNGNKIIDPGFIVDQSIWGPASVGGTGSGVYFNGANAMAANGGNAVALYSPTTWSEGSSVSHLDKAIFPNDMMKHDRDSGSGEARMYSAVEIGMMTDLGYSPNVNTSPVPEPSTYGMMLSGLGLIGWLARRRRT